MTTVSTRNLTSIAGALAVRAGSGPDPEWRESAACLREDPELFFPIGAVGPTAAGQIQQAKEVCAGCPVRRPCLAYAQRTGQEYGIWGGCDENERRLLRRQWPDRPGSAPGTALAQHPHGLLDP